MSSCVDHIYGYYSSFLLQTTTLSQVQSRENRNMVRNAYISKNVIFTESQLHFAKSSTYNGSV